MEQRSRLFWRLRRLLFVRCEQDGFWSLCHVCIHGTKRERERERERERAMTGNSETGERELEVAKPKKPSRMWAGEP